MKLNLQATQVVDYKKEKRQWQKLIHMSAWEPLQKGISVPQDTPPIAEMQLPHSNCSLPALDGIFSRLRTAPVILDICSFSQEHFIIEPCFRVCCFQQGSQQVPLLIKANNSSPRFPADPGNFPAKHTPMLRNTQLHIQPLPTVPEFSEQQKCHSVLPGKDVTQV